MVPDKELCQCEMSGVFAGLIESCWVGIKWGEELGTFMLTLSTLMSNSNFVRVMVADEELCENVWCVCRTNDESCWVAATGAGLCVCCSKRQLQDM